VVPDNAAVCAAAVSARGQPTDRGDDVDRVPHARALHGNNGSTIRLWPRANELIGAGRHCTAGQSRAHSDPGGSCEHTAAPNHQAKSFTQKNKIKNKLESLLAAPIAVAVAVRI